MSDKKNFKVLPIGAYVEKIDFSIKMVKVNRRVLFFANFIGPMSPMLHSKPFGSREEGFLKGLYHIWAWKPSWSSDQDVAYKLSFPLTFEAPYEIWL